MQHQGKTFTNADVELDDNEFVGCFFDNCTLIYHGGTPPTLVNCGFGKFHLRFEDGAAKTVAFMNGLYRGGFAFVIEATFEKIRGDAYPVDEGGTTLN